MVPETISHRSCMCARIDRESYARSYISRERRATRPYRCKDRDACCPPAPCHPLLPRCHLLPPFCHTLLRLHPLPPCQLLLPLVIRSRPLSSAPLVNCSPFVIRSRPLSSAPPLSFAPLPAPPFVICSPLCHPERSRGICCAPFSFHQSVHELQHRTSKWTHPLAAGSIVIPTGGFLRLSDAGAHVQIGGRRKAHSRSLDCARDDKGGSR